MPQTTKQNKTKMQRNKDSINSWNTQKYLISTGNIAEQIGKQGL